jgi:calmodulin
MQWRVQESSTVGKQNRQKMTSIYKTLSEEELKEFKEIFDLVDKDGSGEISKEELGKLMKTLGLRPTEEQINEMMQEVDTDGSGDIDFNEFVTVMSKKVKAEYTPDQLRSAFAAFESPDDNLGHGWVRTDVLEHALTTYGEDPLSLEKAAELLQTVDPEGTGKFNYLEYVNMLNTQ